MTWWTPRAQGDRAVPVVLGPDAIARVAQTLDRVAPALLTGPARLLPNGNVQVDDEETAAALRALREAVEAALPAEIRAHVGERSGLGWNLFFAHVVLWWRPQRDRIGLLRALVDRAALHGARLALHWNRGRSVPTERRPPGSAPLIWGGIAGAVAAVVVIRLRPGDPVLGVLAIATGVVAGRLHQRLVPRRRCGDPLCRAPLTRRARECPSCGATLVDQ